eukprot:1190223-Prorocentrum_minimum.AAC.1
MPVVSGEGDDLHGPALERVAEGFSVQVDVVSVSVRQLRFHPLHEQVVVLQGPRVAEGEEDLLAVPLHLELEPHLEFALVVGVVRHGVMSALEPTHVRVGPVERAEVVVVQLSLPVQVHECEVQDFPLCHARQTEVEPSAVSGLELCASIIWVREQFELPVRLSLLSIGEVGGIEISSELPLAHLPV